MTDSELAAAARHALMHLEHEQELSRNVLLQQCAGTLSYESRRSVVLQALESLEPPVASAATRKPTRLHAILVRCDLCDEPHKNVLASIGLSRRQFYRERHEALLVLAAAIRRCAARTCTVPAMIELGDAGTAMVEALRSAGQYEQVWQEATVLASRAAGERLETKLWIVASEAARYLARPNDAADALRRACSAAELCPDERQPYSLVLWTAIGEMNLRWAAGDCEGARAAFEAAAQREPEERTLYGDEAILFGIMLGYAASIELDRGRWDKVRSLLARASVLVERGGARSATGRFGIAGQSLLRLSAQLALRGDGDLRRALVEHRSALEADRASGHLGNVAMSAAYYACALQDVEPGSALHYAEYGLEIAGRFYPGDRLARLILELLPLLLETRGPAHARGLIAGTRRQGLGLRDELFLDLADAKTSAHAGALSTAIEQAEAAAARLQGCGMQSWACDAQLVAVDASARLGHRQRAQRRLAAFAETIIDVGRADSRAHARRLGTLLAPSGW